MGTYIFWIVFWGLVLVAFIINRKNAKTKKANRIKAIKEGFGKKKEVDLNNVVSDFSYVDGLLEYRKNISDNEFYIDKTTFFDLNLQELYSRINSTVSSPGEEYLYYRFNSLNQNPDFALREKELIDSYLTDDKKREETQIILDNLSKIKGNDSFELISNLKQAKSESNIKHLILDLLFVLSFCLIFVYPGLGFVSLLVMLCVNISTYFSGKRVMENGLYGFAYALKLIKAQKRLFDSKTDEVNDYEDLFDLAKGSFLVSLKSGTTSNPLSIIFDYIKLIFHIDLICYNKKLAGLSEKCDKLIELYVHLGRIDCAISMASFVKAYGNSCDPTFCSFSEGIDIKEMIHPLNRKPVPNDISVKRGIILTGSNASGKSTFLKSCGINVIFAQNFGFALAKEYRAPIVRLYSSMALNDNIVSEESYYVVESKSLKRICDAISEYNNVFCLIDEVLRGTNTLERISASSEILRFLSIGDCICFAATHDGELTKLLKDRYDMYYFTEIIKDDVLTFPYKINKGVAGEGNAIKLLEMLGYDKNIIDNASKIAQNYKETGKWER